MSSAPVNEPDPAFADVYEEKSQKTTMNPLRAVRRAVNNGKNKIASLANSASGTKKDTELQKNETKKTLDRTIEKLTEFAANNSGDVELDKAFNEITDNNNTLKSIEKLNTTVEKIKLLTTSVKDINEDVEILRDIINELYILSKKTGKANQEKIEKLTKDAKTVIKEISNVVGNIDNAADADLNDLDTAIKNTKTATNIADEMKAIGDYKDDGKREAMLTDRKITSETELTDIKKPRQPKKGGNPYKTAKKQLSNLMSYIPGMSRKTQKKHRKHRRH